MDDPSCARITEKAYAYFKLPYQEKVRILPEKGLLNIYNIYIYAKKCQINRDILQCKKMILRLLIGKREVDLPGGRNYWQL